MSKPPTYSIDQMTNGRWVVYVHHKVSRGWLMFPTTITEVLEGTDQEEHARAVIARHVSSRRPPEIMHTQCFDTHGEREVYS